MYQLHSLQRPGRPRWALAASALLLLLTVGLAAALIARRDRLDDVELGESRVLPAGGVKVRLPDGWEPLPQKEWPIGGIAGVAEPQRGRRPGRRLFLFRRITGPLGLPSVEGASAVVQAAQSLTPAVPLEHKPRTPGRIGTLPGWTVATGPAIPLASVRPFGLGRAALGPGGELVGLILHLAQPPGTGDERLLNKISRHMDLIGGSFAADPQAVMIAAGIRFKPPEDARFTANADPSLPRVRMTGGQGWSCWFLEVRRVPLVASRTPESLVEDYALSVLRQPDLPRPVQTTQLAGAQVAYLSLSVPPRSAPSLCVLCAKMGEQALLMIGRHEREAGRALQDVCQSILATVELSDPG